MRRLGDLAGFNPDWISLELNRMIKALRSVAQQAIEDSKTKREMTEEQARKRYEDLMREKLNEDQLDLFPKKKKALLGSLAATGRLLSKAKGQSCAAVTHHSWPMSSDDNCRVQHCQCEETAVVMNLPSKPL